LFEVLLPAFRRERPEYRIRAVAVGSGEALRLAARGDADVLLTHSPQAEERFMAAGYGESRRPVMFNDFVILGPPDDPAGLRGLRDAVAAVRLIATSRATFVSRGDSSGTHARELELWSAADVAPSGSWYLEAGQGMGAVLVLASEKGAYTLSDRGTYLNMRDRLRLAVAVEGDARLRNQYSVIVVAGAANPAGARTFADWITSPQGQRLIGGFGVDRFGRPLFTPNAGAG
jgi:tungstate transport system substrate-binding protein